MSDAEKTLQELVTDVENATRAHERARQSERAATAFLAESTRNLNDAQKALDAHIEGLRSRAPRGSEWNRPPMIRCDV